MKYTTPISIRPIFVRNRYEGINFIQSSAESSEHNFSSLESLWRQSIKDCELQFRCWIFGTSKPWEKEPNFYMNVQYLLLVWSLIFKKQETLKVTTNQDCDFHLQDEEEEWNCTEIRHA
jgi:hypothetical protein